jgi:precorrin-2 dehydrogenase/sirohydrochlorin ferrochelatase
MAEEFPEVQGGGSLMLAWQVRNKKVLVVGGGEVRYNILQAKIPSQCLSIDIDR